MKMIWVLAISVCLCGTSAFAAGKTLNCQLSSQYLKFTTTITVHPGEDFYNLGTGHGQTVVSWSESECEDDSSITFKSDEFANLKAGESIEGTLKHEEPDMKIKASVYCKYAK